MAGIKKRALQLRYVRGAKPAKRTWMLLLDPSLTVPRHLVGRVDDGFGEWSCQSSAAAAVHWGKEGWGSEESEEERGFTDGEDGTCLRVPGSG